MAVTTDYVNALGAGSGLDTKSIVSAMVTAEGAAKQASIDRNKTEVEAQISEMAKVQSGLNTLRDAFAALDDKRDFNFSAMNNSNPDSVYASYDGTVAQEGTYTLKVSQLAKAEIHESKKQTSADVDINSGNALSFTIQVGDGTVHTVNLLAGEATLDNAAEEINKLDSDVTAWVVQTNENEYRLLLQGPPGKDNDINVSGDSGLIADNKVQSAKNAKLKMNGVDIERASNNVDDLIPGLSLDLVEATNQDVVIAVTQDVTSAQSAITSLVDAYNAFDSLMKEATAIENADGETGALRGDAAIRGIQNTLKNLFMGDSSTPGANIQRLSDIGVSLQRNGEFSVDSEKLASALKNNLDEVTKLFSANTNDQSPYGDKDRGIAGDIVFQIDNYLSTSGTINTKIDTYDAKVQQLEDDQTALDEKLAKVEERYTRQFTTMNQIMDEMKSMQEYLEGQLENLPFTAES